MDPTLSPTVQDYLKIIYDLRAAGREASTSQLAARLGIAPASVTGMLQRLAGKKLPLVNYRKHQGVSLTRRGEQAALEVIRHHRLLEEYLVRTLGYSWDSVHAEADRLEHVLSEDMEARIDALLDHPRRDPHGEPIPTPELVLPEDASVPLADLRPPQEAVIRRVDSREADLLRQLQALGLVPGARFRLLVFSPGDPVARLRLEGPEAAEVTIPAEVTRKVFVETIP